MKRSNLHLAVYVLLVFLSGAVVGALGHRLYSTSVVRAKRGPDEYRRHYVEEMRSRLKLREEQVNRLNAVLDATRARYRIMREKSAPEMKAIQDEQVTRIDEFLNPAQREEYARMRQEREERMKRFKDKPGGW